MEPYLLLPQGALSAHGDHTGLCVNPTRDVRTSGGCLQQALSRQLSAHVGVQQPLSYWVHWSAGKWLGGLTAQGPAYQPVGMYVGDCVLMGAPVGEMASAHPQPRLLESHPHHRLRKPG